MDEKVNAQAELKRLDDKLKVIVAMMPEFTLRLGQIQQPKLETEARDIRDRGSSLSRHLNTPPLIQTINILPDAFRPMEAGKR